MRKMTFIAAALSVVMAGGTAFASDHLFNAATAPGKDQRGFGIPVTTNPSGVSGPAAQPGTVPGEGNPNAGNDQGTPSVNPEFMNCQADGLPFAPEGCGLP